MMKTWSVVAGLWLCAGGAAAQSWVQHPSTGRWYLPVPATPQGNSRSNANSAAIAVGGQLASISSPDENAFLFQLIDRPEFWRVAVDKNAGPWIGAFQNTCSPEPACGWTWDSGEAWSYANWIADEPNNLNGAEDRALFFSNDPSQRSPGWNDWPRASLAGGYIVEVECIGARVPPARFARPGDSVSIELDHASPPGTTFRWQRETGDRGSGTFVDLAVTPRIPAVDSFALTINAVEAADVARYRCVLAAACGSFTSPAVDVVLPESIAQARVRPANSPIELREVWVSSRVDTVASGNDANLTLQDSTGALTVFGSLAQIGSILDATSSTLNRISSIRGVRVDFRGLAEIQSPSNIVPAGESTPVMTFDVTPDDFLPGSPTAETLESQPVRLAGQAFVARGPFAATTVLETLDGVAVWISTDAIVSRLNTTLGGIPNAPCTITGIFTQFDPTTPFDSGYELTAIEILPECPGCPADLDDGSGTGRPDCGVTVDDLIFYLATFFSGGARADLDDGSGTGTLDSGVTIDDLIFFLARFETGC